MKKLSWIPLWLLWITSTLAQSPQLRLLQAVKIFEADPQMKHAILGFCVVDNKNGKVILDRNSEVGLVAASCQKILTSGAAFELLGHDYRYKTELAYQGKIENEGRDCPLLAYGHAWWRESHRCTMRNVSAGQPLYPCLRSRGRF